MDCGCLFLQEGQSALQEGLVPLIGSIVEAGNQVACPRPLSCVAQGRRMAPPAMWAVWIVVWMPALVDHAYSMNSYFILAGSGLC